MTFYIETIGCQQNEYDASQLAFFLKSFGFIETTVTEAETIFILACSVRQTAVDRIFGPVRNWSKQNKKVFITACITDGDKKKLEGKGVIYFADLKELKILLNKFKFSSSPKRYPSRSKGAPELKKLVVNSSNYIPIMTGCNNFCSYCIVPYTRGREVSRPINEIIEEVKNLVSRYHTSKHGSKKLEIVLLGQNVNSYRKVRSKSDFVALLERLNNLDGDFTIGFISNHPKDMTDDIIEAVAILPKIKKQIHLPLQSGSNKILKAMNRPYTVEQYLRLVEKLKTYDLRLTTDIIVGFPGETEEDFQKTVNICKKIKFDLAYINKYSPRKGTAAYKFGDPILWKEKQRRWKILNILINK